MWWLARVAGKHERFWLQDRPETEWDWEWWYQDLGGVQYQSETDPAQVWGPRWQSALSSQLSALSNNEESVSHSRKLTGNPGWTVAQDWPRQTADNAGSQLHFSLRGRAGGLVCFLSSALKSLTSEQLRFLRGSFLNNFLHCLLQFFLSCRLLLAAEEEN